MWLGVQGKAEQQLGGLAGRSWRLGRAGEAAELCGVAELLGVQGKAEQRLGGAEAWQSGGGGGAFGCSPYSSGIRKHVEIDVLVT